MKKFKSESGEELFVSADGTLFDDEGECEQHEDYLDSVRDAVNFKTDMKLAGLPDNVVSRYASGAMAFLAWKNSGAVPDFKPRTKSAKKEEIAKK